MTYQNQPNNEKAIEHYTKAIELKPDYAEAYNNRGNAYLDMNKLDQAVQDYNKAIELEPDLAKAYINRSIAYPRKDDRDRALVDLKRAEALAEDQGLTAFCGLSRNCGRTLV